MTKKLNILILLLLSSVVMMATTVGTQPSSGDGTSANPYILETSNNLIWFAHQVNTVDGSNGLCAKLGADITPTRNLLNADGSLNGTPTTNWKPIGMNEDHYYTGTFDGNGHVISGLYANETGNVGFIANMTYNATVKNLVIADSYFVTSTADGYAGGICANVANGGNESTVTIQNCGCQATVINGDMENKTGTGIAGGICGFTGQQTTISGCYFYSKWLLGASNQTGALVGVNGESTNLTMDNCYANGEVIGYDNQGTKTYDKAHYFLSSRFESGEVAYLLNSHNPDVTWTQTLYAENGNIDKTPTFGHKAVYHCIRTAKTVNLSKGDYVTIWDTDAIELSNGVKAYKAKGIDSDKRSIILYEVAADQTAMLPLILYAKDNAGSYKTLSSKAYFNVPEDDLKTNLLCATYPGRTVTTDNSHISYMLQTLNGKTLFYPLASGSSYTFQDDQGFHSFLNLNANSVTSSKTTLQLQIEDSPAGIADIEKDQPSDHSPAYNLCGQRITHQPRAGVYIIKGKKYLAK